MVSHPFVKSLQEDSAMSSADFARDLKSASIQFYNPLPSLLHYVSGFGSIVRYPRFRLVVQGMPWVVNRALEAGIV